MINAITKSNIQKVFLDIIITHIDYLISYINVAKRKLSNCLLKTKKTIKIKRFQKHMLQNIET